MYSKCHCVVSAVDRVIPQERYPNIPFLTAYITITRYLCNVKFAYVIAKGLLYMLLKCDVYILNRHRDIDDLIWDTYSLLQPLKNTQIPPLWLASDSQIITLPPL